MRYYFILRTKSSEIEGSNVSKLHTLLHVHVHFDMLLYGAITENKFHLSHFRVIQPEITFD